MLELRGLPAGSPIAFMAALGLMRVLADDLNHPVRLGWQDGYAVLDGLDKEAVMEALLLHIKGRHLALEFTWGDSTRKIPVNAYRAACLKARTGGDRRTLDFMAGWASEALIDKDGNIRGTRLDLTSGQQKLIRDLRNLASQLQGDDLARKAFETALFGGAYDNDQASFGLDPATQRSHATEHQAPTKSKSVGKRGWVWLFAESIPMHPVVPVDDRRAWPAGFDDGYYWPIWSPPIGLDELKALRLLSRADLGRLSGIAEIWYSAYLQIGKYGAFGQPRREPVVM